MSAKTVTVRGKPESPVGHPTVFNASPMRFVGLQFVHCDKPDPAKSFHQNFYQPCTETVPLNDTVAKAMKRGDLVEVKPEPVAKAPQKGDKS